MVTRTVKLHMWLALDGAALNLVHNAYGGEERGPAAALRESPGSWTPWPLQSGSHRICRPI